MLPSVFFSYAWADQPFVESLRLALKAKGLTHTFFDKEDILPGNPLFQRIGEGIDEAQVVLVCLSSAYVTRLNCNREIQLSACWGKRVIVLRLPTLAAGEYPPRAPRDYALAMAPLLAGTLYLDVPDVSEEAVGRVLAALKGAQGPPEGAGAAPAAPIPSHSLPGHAELKALCAERKGEAPKGDALAALHRHTEDLARLGRHVLEAHPLDLSRRSSCREVLLLRWCPRCSAQQTRCWQMSMTRMRRCIAW